MTEAERKGLVEALRRQQGPLYYTAADEIESLADTLARFGVSDTEDKPPGFRTWDVPDPYYPYE